MQINYLLFSLFISTWKHLKYQINFLQIIPDKQELCLKLNITNCVAKVGVYQYKSKYLCNCSLDGGGEAMYQVYSDM